ncbi:baseplate J/gp47 family protein [Nannocystis pusilla]|uniref:Baseplate J/gp47 family protein n=1 Tax=Nannocystis pusilla TaxID=889268 RepID=A0A9X3IUL5_9BACT|nr:baseplate J/gp47 family protein [Nannocystis pusilla]MCY1003985.1 baseplate J/gp47 family protein [Nannocystis pusilla]MCY1008511.1 baseplate J/gp47 family protein [Nannocystis pusilla]
MKSDGANLPGTTESAFCEAEAGVSHGLHGRLSQVAANAFPQTAEAEQLRRHAARYGVFKRESVRATGPVRFIRTQVEGQVVEKGQRAKVGDVEVEVLTDTPFPGVALEVSVPCRAVSGGQAGNLPGGTTLTLVTPVVGVSSTAQVVDPDGLTGGTDEETDLELLTRLLERLADPPNGGGPNSYESWAKEVPGVTRVWEFGNVPKPGRVTVLFMRDNDMSGDVPDPFPGAPEVAAVTAKILEKAPLHLKALYVQAPIDKPLSLTFSSLTPNTPEVRAAIVDALRNMLATKAAPPRVDGAVFYKSWLNEAISSVAGEVDHKLSVPAGDVALNKFELLTLADPDTQITWPV